MKNIAKYLMFVFIFLILLVQMFGNSDEREYDGEFPIDYSSPTCAEDQNIMHDGVITSRSWQDYHAGDYCSSYKTHELSFLQSMRYRNNYPENPYLTQDLYWKDIYEALAEHDFEKLRPLSDSLWDIAEENDLDRDEFANLVVSFVQDIPYSYILEEESCADQEGNFDCVTNRRFGLISPIEFLHTLKGDCDTRTVLLYALLKHFDYSPKIVNSWKYLHSMLLLDVASNGSYLEKNGQRFYFWETTSVGWQAGDVPPDMTDLSSWRIILG